MMPVDFFCLVAVISHLIIPVFVFSRHIIIGFFTAQRLLFNKRMLLLYRVHLCSLASHGSNQSSSGESWEEFEAEQVNVGLEEDK